MADDTHRAESLFIPDVVRELHYKVSALPRQRARERVESVLRSCTTMTGRHTIIASEDYPRLQALVNSRVVRLVGGPDRLDQLQTKLATAQILSRDEVPSDIVTMNSAVVLRDLATSTIETYTLVS